jgi:hypothetical protein
MTAGIIVPESPEPQGGQCVCSLKICYDGLGNRSLPGLFESARKVSCSQSLRAIIRFTTECRKPSRKLSVLRRTVGGRILGPR